MGQAGCFADHSGVSDVSLLGKYLQGTVPMELQGLCFIEFGEARTKARSDAAGKLLIKMVMFAKSTMVDLGVDTLSHVQMLVQEFQANLTGLYEDTGETILTVAACNGHYDTLMYLLKLFVIPSSGEDGGETVNIDPIVLQENTKGGGIMSFLFQNHGKVGHKGAKQCIRFLVQHGVLTQSTTLAALTMMTIGDESRSTLIRYNLLFPAILSGSFKLVTYLVRVLFNNSIPSDITYPDSIFKLV